MLNKTYDCHEAEIEFIGILNRFRKIIKPAIIAVQTKYENNIEKWYEAELLIYLDGLQSSGSISGLMSQVKVNHTSSTKVDLFFKIGDIPIWIELKSWLHGHQKGTNYKFSTHCTRGANILTSDENKLFNLDVFNKYFVIFSVKNPYDDINIGISNFNRDYKRSRLVLLTDTYDYGDDFFMAIMRIQRNVN